MSYQTDRLEALNYEMDSRVRAARRGKPAANEAGTEMTVLVGESDEGEEEFAVFPCKFEVCSTCQGRGTHVNPSIDSGGISSEDFYDDPDFAADYMGGVYDVCCYECGGRNVSPVIDCHQLKNDDKLLDQFNRWQKRMDDDADWERESAMERALGC